jgi:hypothetical protein
MWIPNHVAESFPHNGYHKNKEFAVEQADLCPSSSSYLQAIWVLSEPQFPHLAIVNSNAYLP